MRLVVGIVILTICGVIFIPFGSAAFKLYQQFPVPSLLQYSVSTHHKPAIYFAWRLNPKLSNPILQLAANYGQAEAQMVLARYYQQKQQLKKAIYWLTKSAEESASARESLVSILLQQKQYKALDINLQRWRTFSNQQTALLKQLSWLTSDVKLPRVIDKPDCVMKIQPVSSSLAGIKHANKLVAELIKDKRLSALNFCVNEPHLLRQSLCPARQDQTNCVLTDVAEQFNPNSFSHLMVVQHRPKSFVQTGVMWLSDNAPYSLFIHELAHFAGFVDEYPLSVKRARQHCTQLHHVPNLTKQKTNSTLINTSLYERARTCEVLGLEVYKRASGITFMEYHDTGLIPQEYVRSWQNTLKQPNRQIPAYIAVAQALEHRKKHKLANVWHQQAMKFWRIN